MKKRFNRYFRRLVAINSVVFLIIVIMSILIGLSLTFTNYRSGGVSAIVISEHDFNFKYVLNADGTFSDFEKFSTDNDKGYTDAKENGFGISTEAYYSSEKINIYLELSNFNIVRFSGELGDYLSLFSLLIAFILAGILLCILISGLISRFMTKSLVKSFEKLNIDNDSKKDIHMLGEEFPELLPITNKLSEQLDQRKRFSSNVSHEITTPLSNILYSTTNLLNSSKDLPKSTKSELQNIKRQTNNSIEIVNALMRISRYDYGDMQLETTEFDIIGTISDKLVKYGQQIADSQISVIFSQKSDRLLITADEAMIEIVVDNLLKNAIIYGGSYIEINCEITDANFVFTIANDGEGIPKEDVAKVFELFYRVNSISVRNIPGHGLGLPLAERIVEFHGGKIKAASSNGRTEFAFTLPQNYPDINCTNFTSPSYIK